MSAIEFIEKEPYTINTLWAKNLYYPCYMVKDGTEIFLWSRSEPSDRAENEDIERRKQQLLNNDGVFFMFHDHSGHNSPIDFLEWLVAHELTLHDDFTYKSSSDGKMFDFHGNVNECSCAFYYRIYDRKIIKEVFKRIVRQNVFETYLHCEQLQRLYDVFVFNEDEEICAAWFESDGLLRIDYDSPSGGTIYETKLDDEEGEEKFEYILIGENFKNAQECAKEKK